VVKDIHQKRVRSYRSAMTIMKGMVEKYKATILSLVVLSMIKKAETTTIELGTINVSRNFFEVEKQLVKTINESKLDVCIVQDLQNSRRQLKSKRVRSAREMMPEGKNYSFYRRNKQRTVKYGARLDRWIINRGDLKGRKRDTKQIE